MNLDMDLFRRALARECELAVDHYHERPSGKSRSEALMVLEGIFHGVEITALSLRPTPESDLMETARAITREHQELLRQMK